MSKTYEGKFTPKIVDMAYKLSLLRLTDKEMISFFGIAEQTWYNWQKAHLGLRDAIRRGKTEADSDVVQALFRKACGYSHSDIHIFANIVKEFDPDTGKLIRSQVEPLMIPITKHYPPDTGAACFWLKNRSRHRDVPWIEVARQELTGKDGGPIRTIQESDIDLADLSDAELKMLEAIGAKITDKKTKQTINLNDTG